MINVPDSVKNAFLSDSTKKVLTIKVVNPDDLTLNELNYSEVTSWSDGYVVSLSEDEYQELKYMTDQVDLRALNYLDYIRASVYLKISNITSNPGTLRARCTIMRGDDPEYLDSTITIADYTSGYVKLNFDYTQTSGSPITEVRRIELANLDSTDFDARIEVKNLQVEMADDVNDFPTEYSEHFSKDYDIEESGIVKTIENDNIEFESFSLTESLCSQDNIKFGLCEAAHCEVSVVGYDGNLNGKEIHPYIGVKQNVTYDNVSTVNWHYDESEYMTPETVFTDTADRFGWTYERLFNTYITDYSQYFGRYGNIKATLDFKIDSYTGDLPTRIMFAIICRNTSSEQVEYRNSYEDISRYTNGYVRVQFNFPYIKDNKPIRDIERIYMYVSGGGTYSVTYSIRHIGIYIANEEDKNTPAPVFDADKCMVYNGTVEQYLSPEYNVPLGVFNVSDVKLEHSQNLIKKKITAYDNLLKLEQNAYNWYTQYMFAVSTDDYQNRYDVEYARQIYSAYFDFMITLGLDSRENYNESLLATYDYNTIINSYLSSKRITWQTTVLSSTRDRYIVYSELPVANVSPDNLYMIDAVNYYEYTDEEILDSDTVNDYASHIDPLKRGLVTNGGVMVEAYKIDDSLIDSFVVNRRDYFMLPEDTKYLKVYCPISIDTYFSASSIESYPLIDSISIYEIEGAPELVNGSSRLFYYNIYEKTISEVDSSITGRDVVRSLLEVCGCFFRLNRLTGRPEFIYCAKSGLYPSNNLYPQDDLFPRAGTSQVLPNGRYMSSTQSDYKVQDYGKIQVIVQTKSSDTKSVCQMEYVDDDKGPNTYLIDDNIFYSNENFDREYDYAYPLIQRMYDRICNMGYVPNVTEALGMPWVECGDRIAILTYTNGFESFIFRRTLKGIQLLVDTYESTGDEYIEAVKEFGYELYN